MREAGGCRGFGFAARMVCCACAEFCLSVWSALGRIFIQPLMFRLIRSIRSAVPWARLALTPPFRCRCAVLGRPEAVPTPGRFLVLADLASGLCTHSRCACLRVLLRPGALRATLSNVPCSRRGSAVHAQVKQPPQDPHLGGARVLVAHLGAHRLSSCFCWGRGSVPPSSWSWIAVHVCGPCLVEEDRGSAPGSAPDAPRDAKG